MSQANPFMITAVGRLYNFEKDQVLNADELAVLRQKLKALVSAFKGHVERVPSEAHAGIRRYILKKLHEYTMNLSSMNKYKNRIELVGFVRDMALKNEDYYGKEVAQTAREFLRYWENHALPGKQV